MFYRKKYKSHDVNWSMIWIFTIHNHFVLSVVMEKLLYNYVCRYIYLHGYHDDVIKWKHFSRNWPFVRGIHRSPVNSPHKGQWRGALMFSLIWVWINGWVNNREAGDLRHYRAHYDVIVMDVAVLDLELTYILYNWSTIIFDQTYLSIQQKQIYRRWPAET